MTCRITYTDLVQHYVAPQIASLLSSETLCFYRRALRPNTGLTCSVAPNAKNADHGRQTHEGPAELADALTTERPSVTRGCGASSSAEAGRESPAPRCGTSWSPLSTIHWDVMRSYTVGPAASPAARVSTVLCVRMVYDVKFPTRNVAHGSR
jgi:hypothetical protein